VRALVFVLVSSDVWGKKESYSLILLLVNFSMNFVAGIFFLIHNFRFLVLLRLLVLLSFMIIGSQGFRYLCLRASIEFRVLLSIWYAIMPNSVEGVRVVYPVCLMDDFFMVLFLYFLLSLFFLNCI